MRFSCYKVICQLLVLEGTIVSIFLLCRMTLHSKLFSRSKATEGVCIQQIRCKKDMLMVYLSRMKNNHIGLNKDNAGVVYINLLMLAACPLKAFASFLYFPKIFMVYQRLFPGKDQQSTFDCLLHECFIKYKANYQANGDDATELGSHT